MANVIERRNANIRYADGATGSGCVPTGTSEKLDLEEAKVEPDAIVVSRRRLEWFGLVKKIVER